MENCSITEEIYNIMQDYETEGMDLYNHGLIYAIDDFLRNYAKIPYRFDCLDWPNAEGGAASFAYNEGDMIHLVCFSYKYTQTQEVRK